MMNATGETRIYVGFGFGAIQAGLFLYEAFRSGNFDRLVVAEVLPEVVSAIRRANGSYTVNIAHADRIKQAEVGPIVIEDPAVAADRGRLVTALAGANEIGTAIPSVTYYVSEGPGSLHRLLAEGLRQKVAQNGPQAVIYTAENHNHAAEILAEAVLAEIPAAERPAVQKKVRFLNTVIGKMSGIVEPGEIEAEGLSPITPEASQAFLVEAFNRILISQIQFNDNFQRGIEVFEEKEALLPFEEAKLYGHNATHALAAYLGAVAGVTHIADVRAIPGVLPFLRTAFIEESGAALIRKHAGVDPLFTPAGYQQYADDLLVRMTNPYLRDTVERVGRDPQRKLGWNDRLIGTIRLALTQGITARRYGTGAAAALATLDSPYLADSATEEELLLPLWRSQNPDLAEQETVLALIKTGRETLQRWLDSGFQEI